MLLANVSVFEGNMRVLPVLYTSLLLCCTIGSGIFSNTQGLQKLVKKSDFNTSCSLISVPKNDQCSYIRDNCLDNITGSIDYLSLYYCKLGKIFTIGLIFIILSLCFLSFGITAGEFLCPNLYIISKTLHLSDNVAGLTLLAFGNAAPDVLSIYKAMSIGSGNLAVSQLMGATFFIISMIIGTIGILHPFKVSKSQFISNLLFLLVVVLIIIFAIITKLNFIICLLLVLTYITYVSSAIINQSIVKSRISKLISDRRSRSNYILEDPVDEFDEVLLNTFSDLQSIDELSQDKVSNHLGIPGSYGLKLLLQDLARLGNGSGFNLDNRNINSAPKSPTLELSSNPTPDREIHSSPAAFAPYLDNLLQPMDSSIENDLNDPESLQPSNYKIATASLHKLLPALEEFTRSNYLYKFYHAVSIPITFLLRITTPVRDESYMNYINQNIDILKSDKSIDLEFDKQLLSIQTFMGLNLLMYTTFCDSKRFWYTTFPITVIVSALLGWIVNINYKLDFIISSMHKIRYLMYSTSILGFLVSISWISIFATEIVSILGALGIIFNLSEEILGITIFSIGNSIADFISNIMIARMGMPLMAYSACFGGPLLSLCSLGVSGLILIPKITAPNYNFAFNGTLRITSTMLIVSILILCYMVPRNDWMIDKKVGTILVVSWICSTTLCVIFEST